MANFSSSRYTASKTKRASSRPTNPAASRTELTQATRLPYLFDATFGLRGSISELDVNPLTLTTPVAEERQERDLAGSSSNNVHGGPSPASRVMLNKKRLNKKQTARLLPSEIVPTNCRRIGEIPRIAPGDHGPSLSALDERVLILCHSSLKHARKQQLQQQQQQLPPSDGPGPSLNRYDHEATFAATQIQKIARGVATRTRLRAFHCPRNQRAAARIQFAFRRLVVSRHVIERLMNKRYYRSIQIQAWYRGCRCRDLLAYQRARVLNQQVAHFQRYFRGHRLWRVVKGALHQQRNDCAIEIQRSYRGWKGRLRVVAIRYEQNRHVRNLLQESERHVQYARCNGCKLDACTESSLFSCFMVRYVGLHDFKGARTLCEDGIGLFPSSSRFLFFFSVLLQAICEDMETAMAFLKRANEIGIDDYELMQCETCFFLPALLLNPNDAQALLNLAILSQSRDQLPRAEANYAKALALSPADYGIPGYLHRLNMVDRLLLNYHRFCSIFSFRQVNVLSKEVSISKKGNKVRLMVSKLNHFTVIAPADAEDMCRINTLYLADDEVFSIIKRPNSDGGNDNTSSTSGLGAYTAGNESKNSRSKLVWQNSSSKGSTRRKIVQSSPKDSPEICSVLKTVIAQLSHQEIVGLNIRPNELAQFSESRSNLRLTRPNAEMLLGGLVFVAPIANVTQTHRGEDELPEPSSRDRRDSRRSPPAFLRHAMLIPSILKMRQQLRSEIVLTNAAIDVQRVYRGFQLRAMIRRESLLNEFKQKQVDNVYLHLHQNYVLRERRCTSAAQIQRIYKGFACRKLVRRWQAQSSQIQRLFRGYRGRIRAAAFREGNCTFYMAQRVFQRGMDISGRRVMLIIEKCGLSFRLDGYDLEACAAYHGFFSHSSTMALLCYLNWTYGESLCGREFTRQGDKMIIRSVSSINCRTAECLVTCDSLVGESSTEISCAISLADSIQAINLRHFSAMGKDALVLPLPMTIDDTTRIVEAIATRAILIPSLRMATEELKRRAPAGLTLSVQPPPRMHFTFQRKSPDLASKLCDGNNAAKSVADAPGPSTLRELQLVFPVIDGLRGVSIGEKHFRKKCTRHAVQFTRCRCVLPIVSTSAHVEVIGRALAPPPSRPLS